MNLQRTSSAVWRGDGATGRGVLNTQSGAFKGQPYSFDSRFKDESGKSGTNPEELIGAAHAGCFTMALAFALKENGFTAEEIRTEAKVSVGKTDKGFEINQIQLNLNAVIPGIDDTKFQELAASAKENCPVSKALASVEIKLEAKLSAEKDTNLYVF